MGASLVSKQDWSHAAIMKEGNEKSSPRVCKERRAGPWIIPSLLQCFILACFVLSHLISVLLLH